VRLEISKSQVSALTATLDAEIAEWRMRPLTEPYPYLIFDARYEKVRRGGQVISQGVLVLSDQRAGYREVLGCWVAESESEPVGRGLQRVEAARIARRSLCGERRSRRDGEAIERHFQGAVWQRCQVILCATRWRCAAATGPMVLQLMKLSRKRPRARGPSGAGRGHCRVGEESAQGGAAAGRSGEEILGVYVLPEAHQKRMRTTNMLERQNQELKRRTRVVRVFPHEHRCCG